MTCHRNLILIREPGASIIWPGGWRLCDGVGHSIVLLEDFILAILLPGEIACIEELKLTQALFDVISCVKSKGYKKKDLEMQRLCDIR